MRRNGRLSTLVLCLGMLAAAGTPAAPPPPGPAAGGPAKAIEAVFVCGAETMETRFAGAALTLRRGDRSYDLTRALSGSGARYTGVSAEGPVEFWNKGRDARLTIGSRTFPECHQQGAAR